ncbi:hypothetical protein EB061_09300 [bacterium]|nr:hypothetical protein [bacterium]
MKLSEQVTTSIFEHCQYDLDRFATPTMAPRVLTEEVVKCLAWTLAADPSAREAFQKLVRENENTLHGE